MDYRSLLRRNILVVLAGRLLLVLALFTLCRLIFYWYNRDLFPGMDLGRFGLILGGGLVFDIAGMLYLNALVILAMVIPLRIRFHRIYQRVIMILFISINAFGLLVNLTDTVYYRTTLRRSTLMVLDQFSNETNLAELLPKMLADNFGMLLIFIVLILVVIYLTLRGKVEGPKFPKPLVFYGGGLITTLLAVLLIVGGIRGGFRHSTRPITVSNAMAYATAPEDVALVVNTPFSLIRTSTTGVIRKVAYFADEGALEQVFNPVHLSHTTGEFRPLNVVVIIVESLSMELTGYYNQGLTDGDYPGFTPFLDSLAEHSMTWQYGFANGRKSIDAMPSVLCSIPSVEVPFVLSHYSGNKVNSLASLLAEKGYSTAFFHGAPNGSMGFDAFSRQAGFSRYFGMTEYGNNADMDGTWGIWDMPFLQYTANEMDKLKEPFCAAVFTLSSHHPFEVPQEYQDKFRTGTNGMHQAIQYTDLSLRRFFSRIQKEEWFKRTLFVITADHVSSELTLGPYKTPWGQFAIPIMFYGPGVEPRLMADQVAQQTDILPTVLSMLNYEKPFVAFGRDLLTTTDSLAFNYFSPVYQLISPNFIHRSDGEKMLGSFDFRKDPLMTKDSGAGQEMLRPLQARIQQYNNRMVEDRLVIFGQARLW